VVNQNVLGLHVPVQDTLGVGVVQGGGDLLADPERLFRFELPSLFPAVLLQRGNIRLYLIGRNASCVVNYYKYFFAAKGRAVFYVTSSFFSFF
jgi:hypothetical protein